MPSRGWTARSARRRGCNCASETGPEVSPSPPGRQARGRSSAPRSASPGSRRSPRTRCAANAGSARAALPCHRDPWRSPASRCRRTPCRGRAAARTRPSRVRGRGRSPPRGHRAVPRSPPRSACSRVDGSCCPTSTAQRQGRLSRAGRPEPDHRRGGTRRKRPLRRRARVRAAARRRSPRRAAVPAPSPRICLSAGRGRSRSPFPWPGSAARPPRRRPEGRRSRRRRRGRCWSAGSPRADPARHLAHADPPPLGRRRPATGPRCSRRSRLRTRPADRGPDDASPGSPQRSWWRRSNFHSSPLHSTIYPGG